MFKKYCYSFLLMLLGYSLTLQGQDLGTGYESGTTFNVLYRNDASGKIYAATRGFGASFRRGKHINAKLRSFYEIDGQNLKYPKETKVTGDAADRRRFVYGKINNVLLIRAALGLQHTLFTKADNKAVEVRYAYSLGPTFAFAKPYYVQVQRITKAGTTENALAVFDDASFSDPEYSSINVTGRGSILQGLSETKVYPGISAKFNLSFEYAPYTNLIRAIETSITVDYFPKALPIMARNSAENIVVQLNLGFVFGKKWY